MSASIYLDYNATTPVAPTVLEKMLPFFSQHYGNPSSEGHMYGWAASVAVENARSQVSEALGATRPSNIVFTSGASEGINAVIKGVGRPGSHIVTVSTEHKATINSCKSLQRNGVRVTYLSVDPNGLIDLDELESSLSDDTVLVSIMWANNETGVVQPIKEIGTMVRNRGILLMTDAAQAVGKLPVSVADVDVLTLSAHKFYGPKGVGVTYVRERIRIPAFIDGGGQEYDRRSGTLNVPGIVGLGEAISLAYERQESEFERIARLRDMLEQSLCEAMPDVRFNGAGAARLPNTSSVTFPEDRCSAHYGINLPGVAVSLGSACTTGSSGVSHVLSAMGLSASQERRTIRISLGHPTTPEEIRMATSRILEGLGVLTAS